MGQKAKSLITDVTQPDVLMSINSRAENYLRVIAMDQLYAVEPE